ncbi:MAG: hypothetical protein IJY00_00360, partial [Bacteroidaceae bacterium]|nr:hypothetical protein [Bacteroidaceae bacterium]
VKIIVEEENVFQALQRYQCHKRHDEPGKPFLALSPKQPCHHAVEHKAASVDEKYIMRLSVQGVSFISGLKNKTPPHISHTSRICEGVFVWYRFVYA